MPDHIHWDTLLKPAAEAVGDPTRGLPEDAFLFVSSLTPMVNVDLLIQNAQGETLLTWREDAYYGAGWHVPGGIVRCKERLATRIETVARLELGAAVQCDPQPLCINEVISTTHLPRCHFISLLYRCALVTPPADALRHAAGAPRPGEWRWHATCPADLLPVHEMYRTYF